MGVAGNSIHSCGIGRYTGDLHGSANDEKRSILRHELGPASNRRGMCPVSASREDRSIGGNVFVFPFLFSGHSDVATMLRYREDFKLDACQLGWD